MFPNRLRLSGADFDRICVRHSGIAVYRGDQAYLRIGPGMDAELVTQRQLLGCGFPVARIIGQGEHEGFIYVIEESLGPETLGERFLAELHAGDGITRETFSTYLNVAQGHARAQADMASEATPQWNFARLVGVDQAAALLPDLNRPIHRAFDGAVRKLRDLPESLLHGDLHEHNMCAGGVIDLEDIGWGPAGYDVTTAVFIPALCNIEFGTAARPRLWYSSSQVDVYLAMVDDVFMARGIAGPSEYLDEFLLCRAISLCARKHREDIWRGRQKVLATLLADFQVGGDLRVRLQAGR